MSYILENNCVACRKSDKCIDNEIISGAIQMIHAIMYDKGHNGAGTVTMECQNFDPKIIDDA